MPGPTQYPTPDISGPQYAQLIQHEPEYQVVTQRFQDGGSDAVLLSDNPVKRWTLIYTGLTAAEAATLDAHADSAKIGKEGSFYAFTFKDPRSGTTYTGTVKYDHNGYKVDSHQKSWAQRRTVHLVLYP